MAKDPSKTEEATPKRLEKQREEGNVPKSQELPKTMALLVGTLSVFMYSGTMVASLERLFIYFLENLFEMPLDKTDAYKMLYTIVTELAVVVLPILLMLYASAYLTLRMEVGALWTTKVFKVKWENFNIFNGLQRLFFSAQTFVRLGKNIFLALIIGYVPYLFLMSEYPNFINLYYLDPPAIAEYMASTAFKLIMYALAPMFVIALVDLWYTRYQYNENNKMSKQEVKDEHKQSQGDMEMKQKQKQFMMQILAKQMFGNVPKADVVVTNPTHYAVALMYDPTTSNAPIVVAKGVDHVAKRIKEIAADHKVPIRENKPLAQALYKQTEVGDVIPEDLFKAVAALLAQIWKLKGKSMGR